MRGRSLASTDAFRTVQFETGSRPHVAADLTRCRVQASIPQPRGQDFAYRHASDSLSGKDHAYLHDSSLQWAYPKREGHAHLMPGAADLVELVVSAGKRLPSHIHAPGRQQRTGRFARVSARSVPAGANRKRISERHA